MAGWVLKWMDRQSRAERKEFRTGDRDRSRRQSALSASLRRNRKQNTLPVLQITDLADSHLHALRMVRNLISKEIENDCSPAAKDRVEIRLRDGGCRSWKFSSERGFGEDGALVNERTLIYSTHPAFLDRKDLNAINRNIQRAGGARQDFLSDTYTPHDSSNPDAKKGFAVRLEIPLQLGIKAPFEMEVGPFGPEDAVGILSTGNSSRIDQFYPPKSPTGKANPKLTIPAFEAWLESEPGLQLQLSDRNLDEIRRLDSGALHRTIRETLERHPPHSEIFSLVRNNAKDQYLDTLAGFGVRVIGFDRQRDVRECVTGGSISFVGKGLLTQLDTLIQKAERNSLEGPRAPVDAKGDSRNLPVGIGTVSGLSVSSVRPRGFVPRQEARDPERAPQMEIAT